MQTEKFTKDMKVSKASPIAFFAFNRPEHTYRSLSAIKSNHLSQETDLYIFCDGPRLNESEENRERINEVRRIIRKEQWCKRVFYIEPSENQGLLKSISNGVTKVVNEYGRVIVVEDDVLVTNGFLKYMNDALEMYDEDERVMHISAYSPLTKINLQPAESTFFYNHTFCWGWATWQRAWKNFTTDGDSLRDQIKKQGRMSYVNLDNTFEAYWGIKHIMEGKFQSWNYFWHTCVNLKNGLCLHPVRSLVRNIGFDGSGTNCLDDQGAQDKIDVIEAIDLKKLPLIENVEIRQKLHKRGFIDNFKFSARHYLKFIIS